MALAVADCEVMIECCAEAGVALGVGFHLRHHPVHMHLKQMIEAGELGEIALIRAEWHTAYPAWTNWRSDPDRAGTDVLSAVGVHALDLIGFLADSVPCDVKSVVVPAPDSGLDGTIATAIEYDNGIVGSMTMTRLAAAPGNGLWVFGSNGMAGGPRSLGMGLTGRLVVARDGETEEQDLPMPDIFAAQFDAYSNAVARGKLPDANGLDGLRSVQLAHRILKN